MFLESILFLQKLKNFKNSVALFWRLSRGSDKSYVTIAFSRVGFGDLFASGRSSREGYTEIVTAQLDSLASKTSSCKKYLANFFKTFGLKCSGGRPWRLARDLTQSRKTRVLHSKGSF